jgi:3-oxoacyl-[acyl-carrier protein] reductase
MTPNFALTGKPVLVRGANSGIGRQRAARHGAKNAIAPGPVQTGWISDEFAAKVMPSIPLGRLGTPDDIASAAAFLLSDAAGWITGQVIRVAGRHAL